MWTEGLTIAAAGFLAIVIAVVLIFRGRRED
jgi:hypothetical protein